MTATEENDSDEIISTDFTCCFSLHGYTLLHYRKNLLDLALICTLLIPVGKVVLGILCCACRLQPTKHSSFLPLLDKW